MYYIIDLSKSSVSMLTLFPLFFWGNLYVDDESSKLV